MIELNGQDFNITGKIKEGIFGNIFTARFWNEKNAVVAVKSFKGDITTKKKMWFHTDVEVLRKIEHHENIVKMIGYYVNHHNRNINCCIVMNYEGLCVRGRWINDLFSYLIHLREELERKKRGVFDENYEVCPKEELHSFAIGIAKGCHYLETKQIIIGDLSTKSVLINQNKMVKVADFNFINIKRHLVTHSNVTKFSYRYTAPEVTNNWKFTRASDIWAYGIVLWEIKTLGGLPFRTQTPEELMNRSEIIDIAKCLQNDYTLRCAEIVRECLIPWPNEKAGSRPCRAPSFAYILRKLTSTNCMRRNDTGCEVYKNYNSIDPHDSLPFTEEEILETMSWKLDALKVEEHLFLKTLGNGIFGSVHLTNLKNGKYKPKCSNFAVKKFDSFTFNDESFQIISQKLKRLKQHRNIIQIFAYSKPLQWVLMEYQSISIENNKFTELTGLGEYLQFLRIELRKGKNLNSQELGWFSVQIARGMAHLEKLKILHGNLAARNILINEAKIVKITDFFLPISNNSLDLNKKLLEQESWIRWASPEVISNFFYSVKSDVWSFGVVLWEIVTLGGYPAGRHKLNELDASARSMIQPDNVTAHIWNIMDSCWRINPKDRPSFENIYLDLDALTAREMINFEINLFNVLEQFPTKEEFERGQTLMEQNRPNKGSAAISIPSRETAENCSPFPFQFYNFPHSFPPRKQEPHGSFYSHHRSSQESLSTVGIVRPQIIQGTPPRPPLKNNRSLWQGSQFYSSQSPQHFPPLNFQSPSRPNFRPQNGSPVYRNMFSQAARSSCRKALFIRPECSSPQGNVENLTAATSLLRERQKEKSQFSEARSRLQDNHKPMIHHQEQPHFSQISEQKGPRVIKVVQGGYICLDCVIFFKSDRCECGQSYL